MLDLDKKYVLCKDIVIRGVGDRYWALNTSNGKQFRLNSSSYTILNSFHKIMSLRDTIKKVLEEFSVEEDKVIEDCNLLIPFAIEKQLIEEVTAYEGI